MRGGEIGLLIIAGVKLGEELVGDAERLPLPKLRKGEVKLSASEFDAPPPLALLVDDEGRLNAALSLLPKRSLFLSCDEAPKSNAAPSRFSQSSSTAKPPS